MVIASYIWMKWYALLQFTALASYFIQEPFISFPAELFCNKFRHLINSLVIVAETEKNWTLCILMFKIIFCNNWIIWEWTFIQRTWILSSFYWGVKPVIKRKERPFRLTNYWPKKFKTRQEALGFAFFWEKRRGLWPLFMPCQVHNEKSKDETVLAITLRSLGN